MEDGPRCQRDLVATLPALMAPLVHQLIGFRMPASRTREPHPATDKLPDIAGRLPPWQSRTETGGAFWGMTVGARLHTTYWGLLKQPDNQKSTSNAPPLSLATRDWLLATAFQRAFTACTLGATGEDTSTPPRTWLIPRRADPTQARRSHLDVTWTDATGNESIVGTAGAATSEPLWGITCVAR